MKRVSGSQESQSAVASKPLFARMKPLVSSILALSVGGTYINPFFAHNVMAGPRILGQVSPAQAPFETDAKEAWKLLLQLASPPAKFTSFDDVKKTIDKLNSIIASYSAGGKSASAMPDFNKALGTAFGALDPQQKTLIGSIRDATAFRDPSTGKLNFSLPESISMFEKSYHALFFHETPPPSVAALNLANFVQLPPTTSATPVPIAQPAALAQLAPLQTLTVGIFFPQGQKKDGQLIFNSLQELAVALQKADRETLAAYEAWTKSDQCPPQFKAALALLADKSVKNAIDSLTVYYNSYLRQGQDTSFSNAPKPFKDFITATANPIAVKSTVPAEQEPQEAASVPVLLPNHEAEALSSVCQYFMVEFTNLSETRQKVLDHLPSFFSTSADDSKRIYSAIVEGYYQWTNVLHRKPADYSIWIQTLLGTPSLRESFKSTILSSSRSVGSVTLPYELVSNGVEALQRQLRDKFELISSIQEAIDKSLKSVRTGSLQSFVELYKASPSPHNLDGILMKLSFIQKNFVLFAEQRAIVGVSVDEAKEADMIEQLTQAFDMLASLLSKDKDAIGTERAEFLRLSPQQRTAKIADLVKALQLRTAK